MDAEAAMDAEAEVAEAPSDAVLLAAQFDGLLSGLCSELESTIDSRLDSLRSRLDACANAVHTTKRSHCHERAKLHGEAEELDTELRRVRGRLNREKIERQEEKEWLAQLWPDDVPLPTLLKPLGDNTGARSVKDVEDGGERRRLEALVRRRVMKERVLLQLEAAKHWTMALQPPIKSAEDDDDGESAIPQPYYVNTQTGEATWEAPTAMFYEPPAGWDVAKMDWKSNYGLEHFELKEPSPEPADERDGKRAKSGEESDTGDSDEEDDESKIIDPVECRQQLEAARESHAQLEAQLATSQSQQRTLALQLLNATRDAFEREKEKVAEEDKAAKNAERKRRLAARQEEAAAKAKAEAQRRRAEMEANPSIVQPKFARDSVPKKDLTLAKDDDLLEKELAEFAIQQRADRLYLTAPVATDQRVKAHHQLDEEFVHLKHLEEVTLQVEQLEFDLLEKTSLRYEEAVTKTDELIALADQIRTQQVEIVDELPRLEKLAIRLDEPLDTPTVPRPSAEQLARVQERFVQFDPLASDAVSAEDQAELADSGDTGSSEIFVDDALVEKDELELRQLKQFADAERVWREWEMEEGMRLEEILQATQRQAELVATQRNLAVDIVLVEGDIMFFSHLRDNEKEANSRLWAVQADAQIERARFMVERAAREESVFQLKDRLQQLQTQLDAAESLPLQATNPIERITLSQQSAIQVSEIKTKACALQERYSKEEAARKLLVELELRATRYWREKLEEEFKLFAEKQTLWDLGAQLTDEIQTGRQTIAQLYRLMEAKQSSDEATIQDDEAPSAAVLSDASKEFEIKLRFLQHVRQALLSSYGRESRWRSLAAVALIPASSSDEWMTTAQRERHEAMLALLQEQHDESIAELRRELKLQLKVKTRLQTAITKLETRLERSQREYQAANAVVMCQTNDVVTVLRDKIEECKAKLAEEQCQSRTERERLIQTHDTVRLDLEARLQLLEDTNEQQRHWLTSAKRELHAQRVANEELVKAYQALEKRRATESNDLQFRVRSQIKKICNIEMWNLALKLKAKGANAERVQMRRDMAQLTQQHKQLQRRLRFQIWRHRVAAQAILTDVELLFSFFADGLDILAGASSEINDALRDNGGIEVLSALVTRSSQRHVKEICARALGRVVWNANATQRSLGWQAKRTWMTWMKLQSDIVLDGLNNEGLEFDAVANEDGTVVNWQADILQPTDALASECDSKSSLPVSKKLRYIRTWLSFDDKAFPNENAANQEHIGLSPGILQTLVDLCRGLPDTDSQQSSEEHEHRRLMQRNALRSLALVAMNTRNTVIVGRMDGVIPQLVGLIHSPGASGSPEDWEAVRHAIHALGNLAFENHFNQQQIVQCGAIPIMLTYCDGDLDVDLVLASTQTLANLAFDFVPACSAIFDCQGVAILTRLCSSPRIHDAVELELFEAIQAHAAQTISSVVTLLDSEDNESDNRAHRVADVIMNESMGGEPGQLEPCGVAAFVLMCASCTREVAFHGALVLGNIAQHDGIRAAIGAAGGVDVLFLLADRPHDLELLVQATWALSNLTWNRENQYRVARYLSQLYQICTFKARTSEDVSSPERPSKEDINLASTVREHGLCVLANSLFYNDANRRLIASDRAWLLLIEHNCLAASGPTLEHSARALCALSYNDEIALALGHARLPSQNQQPQTTPISNNNNEADLVENHGLTMPFNGLALFVRLCGRTDSPATQRHALFGIINMCLHDANKPRMLDVPHGVEALVNLSGLVDRELSEPALEALELLADVRQLQGVHGVTSSASLASSDLKTLIALLTEARATPALVAMASDAIADEAWKRPSAKVRLRNEHGLDKLLELLATPMAGEPELERKVAVSVLWALRNAVSDNTRNQDVVGALDGVPQLVQVLDRHRQSSDVQQAALAALVAVVMRHPRNSQQLVQFGLDALLAIADRSVDDRREGRDEGNNDRGYVENAALARELLEVVAPYNSPPSKGDQLPALSPSKFKTKKPPAQAHRDPLPLLHGGGDSNNKR